MIDPEASFEQYLTKKKIDGAAYAVARPHEAQHYRDLFERMGAVSFDHTHKFLINDWRLEFPLRGE